MEPLSLDTYRMAFWYSVCQGSGYMSMADTTLLKQMQTALSSMKVTFVLCGSKEDAEKQKWGLSASSQLLGETRVLRGWKKVIGIVSLKGNLKAWARPCADLDVFERH